MKFSVQSGWALALVLTLIALPALAVESEQEPVDPAEFRVQVSPPERPMYRAAGTWISVGPAPTQSAQVNVPPDDEVCGAIQAIAAHPSNADILFIGAVNGGVWKTTSATAARPTWVPLTDHMPSQSIGALAFDPTDVTYQTLVAGTGRLSNFAQRGDDQIGLYRTVNGGVSWTRLGETALLGEKVLAVVARGATLLAATRWGGLYRSTDTGANWSLISGTGNLPTGGIFDLVSDGTSSRLYVTVDNSSPKILRSDDVGATWTDVTATISGLGTSTSHMRPSVGASGVVFLAVVDTGRLAAVYRSSSLGASWTPMDVPAIHPGGQGFPNTSIAADSENSNRVYLGGDRITSSPYTGNIVVGDASFSPGSQFSSRVDANALNTAPHADSRAMAFDANGNLLQSDDGGIYRRTNPTSTTGVWESVIGNLNVMEVHDLAHDSVSNVIMIGTQDNGTHIQETATDPRWRRIYGGDGGDVAIDDTTFGTAASYRYLSSQYLGSFQRREYSAANIFTAYKSMPSIGDPQFVTPVELSITDPSRLLVGGSSTIYESTNATGASPTLTSLGGPGANRNAIAFGAVGNPQAAYVGKSSAVYKRSGATFAATAGLPSGASTVTDVAMDPDNTNIVFAVDSNQVFRSIDGGASWSDVTGNLPSIAAQDFRTIEFIPDAAGDTVALGTRSGVYTAAVNSSVWALMGTGLPDVLVFDLRYDADAGNLMAGTLGRGVWILGQGDMIFADGFESGNTNAWSQATP